MDSAPHRIRSLHWQVDASSTTEAFSWRTLLHEKGTELLLPSLQQGLDEAAQGEQVLHIPRIELKIRIAAAEELATALSSQVSDQLGKLLPRRAADGEATGPALAREFISPAQSSFDILLHYLQTGMLPWHATEASDREETLKKICLEERLRLLAHLGTAREQLPFYFRLLQLLAKEEGASLCRDMLTSAQPVSNEATRIFMTLLSGGALGLCSEHTRLGLMAAILATCFDGKGYSGPSSLLKVAAAVVLPQEMHLLDQFIAMAGQPGIDSPDSASTRPDLSATLSDLHGSAAPPLTAPLLRQNPTNKSCEELRTAAGISTQPCTQDREQHLERLPEKSPGQPIQTDVFSESGGITAIHPEQMRRSNTNPITDLFPMLVHQAGLVMLHPYLVRFFEHCGIKDADGKGLCPSELPRAAALLHFIASGREVPYEYELGLIKVLLGLVPDTPLLVCSGLLTPDDRGEAEALLSAVISHWSILKDTSIQGLRHSFIERQGLLRQDDNGWRLNVERKPYDILLDQIPWSIGIARLPWMPQAIFTEW